jgi:AcrR family transcriptional regulator
MAATEWTAIVQAATIIAERQGSDIADVSLDDIAEHLGISRATLYRRIGNRSRLNDAIRAAGIDPGGRGDVRERATNAVAEIITEGGFSAFTLEAVAARAQCSIPALHAQLGGRDALLAATFERFSPLPRIEEALAQRPESLEEGVRRIYTIAFDTATSRPRLLAAVIADALARMEGPTARYLVTSYLPRVMGTVGAWLAELRDAGLVRRLPVSMLLQLLIAPIALHAPTRGLTAGISHEPLLARQETIEALTQAYVRAVGLAGDAARDLSPGGTS